MSGFMNVPIVYPGFPESGFVNGPVAAAGATR